MIDFHSHILPDMDDGAKDVQEAINMLTTMRKQGVNYVCLTSHYYNSEDKIESFLERRSKSFEKLKESIYKSGIEMPKLILGAEVQFFYGMSRADLEKLCYQNTNYLLVELPFSRWNSEIFKELQSITITQGVTPIIAHAERYLQYGNKLKDLMALQLPIQINAEAFEIKMCKTLMHEIKKNRCFLFGSDCHNMSDRLPNLPIAYNEINKKLGDEYIYFIDKLGRMILKIQ